MKYTFEVTCRENENIITVEIAYGATTNSVRRTLTFEGGIDNDEPNLEELILDMVNNIRLTVKEREEAIYNVNVFKDYVQKYNVGINKVKQQMIVENGDPVVLVQENNQ